MTNRPTVTLSYAQSLDGSLTARLGTPLAISGRESLKFTHQLRAQHDAILVGIGTVLADNPQLNVRLVPGASPRPVILDSQLRCPPTARLFNTGLHPIIATTTHAPIAQQPALEARGALVLRLPALDARVDLSALLAQLTAHDIRALMIEGGARAITSFLRARLVDRLILTIAPTLIGGAHAVRELLAETPPFPRLHNVSTQMVGDDWIVSGEIAWDMTK